MRRHETVRDDKLGILVQDLSLETLKCWARFDPEFLDQSHARVLEGLKRVRLPSRPVQREHQLGA
jgi:hypothetical protein